MIFISNKIKDQLINLKQEDCGFIFGKELKIDQIYPVKNISKNPDAFKMSIVNVIYFLFKNLLNFIFTDFSIALYHVHTKNPFLSNKDKRNMIEGLLYIIVYQTSLYLYKKENGNIETYTFKLYKEV